MSDLLPCPFCGRDATYMANYWKNVPRVRCSDPEGNCPGFSGGHPTEWNTRTPPPGYALVKLEGAEERVAHIVEAGIDLQSGHQAIAREIIRAMREGE